MRTWAGLVGGERRGGLRSVWFLLVTVGFVVLGSSTQASAAGCPNTAIRVAQGPVTEALPDCMALEMVSPPRKGQVSATSPSFNADGDRIRFTSRAALADTPGQNGVGGADVYVATRGVGGWATASTASPAEYHAGASGVPRFWNADYSRWLSTVSTEDEFAAGISSILEGGLGRDWVTRGPRLVPLGIPLSGPQGIYAAVVSSKGTSMDLSHVVFAAAYPAVTYLPGDPTPAGSAAVNNEYVSTPGPDGAGAVALLARDGAGTVYGGTCGATLGGGGSLTQGAISDDGSRMFFTTRPGQLAGTCSPTNKLRIMRRDETPGGVEISQLISSECARVTPACDTTDSDDVFQAASADGTKVYFTTTRQLVDSDLDSGTTCGKTLGSSTGCDLYLYDATLPAGHRLIQVSAGDASDPTPGAGAGVLSSITAVSGDGSRAYFVAQGVLTTEPNPRGLAPVAGQPNLYVYQRDAAHPNGRTAFIATVASDDTAQSGGLFGNGNPNLQSGASAVPFYGDDGGGGDGHVLVFQSKAPVTADDTDGTRLDVFRYDDAGHTLERISKAEPGGVDNGPHDVDSRFNSDPLGAAAVDTRRWVSENGETVIFATYEHLAPGDVDDLDTVYMWRNGRLTPLPGASREVDESKLGTASAFGDPPVLSRSGDAVAFGTSNRLLAEDGDLVRDLYVARVDGGFMPPPAPAVPCDPLTGVCQSPGPGAAAAPLLGSVGFTGPGNVIPPSTPGAPPNTARLRVKAPKTVHGSSTRLTVRVPGKGRIRISGSGLRRSAKTARKTGTYRVAVKVSSRSRRILKRRHRVKLRATVRFVPAKGKALRVRVHVTFKLRTQKRSRRASSRSTRQAYVLSSDVRKGR